MRKLLATVVAIAMVACFAVPVLAQEPTPVTLNAYIDWPQDDFAGWGSDPVSAEITKRTGVTINLRTASTSDSQELNIMLASEDLPDFIMVGAQSPMHTTLWKQGFALPLNKLIDDYAPEMYNRVSPEQIKIYTEADGNFYQLVDYYCDIEKIAAIPGALNCLGGWAVLKPMYEAVGSPELITLEDYKNLLLKVKDAYPEVSFPLFDHVTSRPQDSMRAIAWQIARIYGAENWKSADSEGNIHAAFKDEPYKKAILYINDLFRAGLINPETFTVTTEQQFRELVLTEKIFSFWGQPYNFCRDNLTEEAPRLPMPMLTEGDIVPKMANANVGIGGWHGLHISTDSKNPEAAIKYLSFLQSDEGQMLSLFGIENEHYEFIDDMPSRLGEARELAGSNWGEFTRKFGIYNYNISWLSSMWADNLEYYNNSKINPVFRNIADFYNPLANNERLYELTQVSSDSDEKVIETKLFDLWMECLPLMYLASSEAECVAQYETFLAKADQIGLSKLESAYSESYKHWYEILNG